MTIQKRLVLLLFAIALTYILMMAIQIRMRNTVVLNLIRSEIEGKQTAFEKIFSLRGESLATLAYDYTIWDEMVAYVSSGDEAWAKANIDEGLTTYSADAAWVFRLDRSMVYAAGRMKEAFPGLTEQAAAQLFEKTPFCHFFFPTEQGVLEIRGSTINSTYDIERKTPAGYFFVGRLWDLDALDAFSRLIGGRLSFIPADGPSREAHYGLEDGQSVIQFTKSLRGMGGDIVSGLQVHVYLPILDYLNKAFLERVAVQSVILVFSIIVVLGLMQRWVNRPLRAISRSLQLDDLAPIAAQQEEKGEFGDISRLIAKFMDQRRQLLLSEERFRQIAASSGDWVWETDADGYYTYANEEVFQIMGYRAEEVVGRHFSDFFVPQEKETLKKATRNIYRRKESIRGFLNRNVRKDGRVQVHESSGSPILDADGNLLGYRGVDRDITDRFRKETRVLEYSSQLTSIINSVVDGITLSEPGGKFFIYNKKMADITGYAPGEIATAAQLIERLYPDPVRRKQETEKILEQARLAVPEPFETVFRAKSGEERTVQVIAKEIQSEGRKMILGIYHDVTRQRRSEDELMKANRDLVRNERALKNLLYDMKTTYDKLKNTQEQLLQSEKMASVGQLASGVAHEIKNPLAIILLSAEAMAAKPGLNEKEQNHLRMIKNAAERANKVIIELLNFSRYSKVDQVPVDLHQTIARAADLVSNKMRFGDVAIKTELYPGQPVVIGDHILLEQIFFNLFSNAIDAIGEKGTITVKTYEPAPKIAGDPRRVVVEVSDTGSGMPEEVLARAFEPFFTTKEQGQGTGLGLSTVYMIVEKHDGKISAASKVGEGTTFTLTLPLKDLA
ncbi:MAG: PAS domain S-box protein [Candidatus Omnitrophota bacterium]|nr:PAS domain S-box protein [Candidatus Omnitrophota bacterium]MDZ4243238.1 PAS domain S-box protein [Candidatus Omnitrophota bacterium]